VEGLERRSAAVKEEQAKLIVSQLRDDETFIVRMRKSSVQGGYQVVIEHQVLKRRVTCGTVGEVNEVLQCWEAVRPVRHGARNVSYNKF
jgi:hypothetical protein